MDPQYEDLELYLGSSRYELLAEFRSGSPDGPVANVTGWSARVDFRVTPASAVLLACTEANGRIVWDRPNGLVFLVLSAADVAALEPTEPHFDVRIDRPGENVWFPRRGRARVKTPITR